MAHKNTLDLFIAAGEQSGDELGGEILQHLSKDLSIAGILGPRMESFGVKKIESIDSFSVMGPIELIKCLPKTAYIFRKIKQYILKENPKVVLLIDNASFSQSLATALKNSGFKGTILKLVCPQIWAWRGYRKKSIEKCFDHLFTLFPFEPEIFKNSRMTTEFIGHPLFEPTVTYKPRNHIEELNEGRIISLFPGSRTSDIKRNLTLQVESVAHLKNCKIAISVAKPSHKEPILAACKAYGVNPILIDRQDRYEQMCKSEFALAKTGTITLELAFFQVPTITQFKISKIEQFLAHYVFSLFLPHYAMPNILAKRRIFPEYCGPVGSVKNIKNEVDNFYNNSHLRELSSIGCQDVIKLFQNHSPSERVAQKIRSLI